MGEVINLNKARKAAHKAADTKAAAENRGRFGLSKLAKTLAEKQQQIDARRLDSVRRDPPTKPK
jgi:hypothetical protein